MFLLSASNNLASHTSGIECYDLYVIALSGIQYFALVLFNVYHYLYFS